MKSSAPVYPVILPELLRCCAGLPAEYGDKVADIMKPTHVADALYLQVGIPDQQLFCPVDPEPDDIVLYGVSGETPVQPGQVLRRNVDLMGQAVLVGYGRRICFDFLCYRRDILPVQRMFCLRMLHINTGKMH